MRVVRGLDRGAAGRRERGSTREPLAEWTVKLVESVRSPQAAVHSLKLWTGWRRRQSKGLSLT